MCREGRDPSKVKSFHVGEEEKKRRITIHRDFFLSTTVAIMIKISVTIFVLEQSSDDDYDKMFRNCSSCIVHHTLYVGSI